MTALHYGVKGRYKLQRRKAIPDGQGGFIAGEVIEETPWSDNLLTTYYFDSVAYGGPSYANGCVVGTGSGAVAEGNTGLTTYLAGTNQRLWYAVSNNFSTSPRYCRQTCTYRFNPGAATGNISEMAIVLPSSGITSATPIISRALVVDGTGTPTSIAVLADEYLDVIWQYTIYVPEDQTGSVTFIIDGVNTAYNYTIRACALNTSRWGYSGLSAPIVSIVPAASSSGTCASTQSTLAAYNAMPSRNGDATSVANQSWIAGSRACTKRITWGLSTANVAIRSFLVCAADSVAGGLGAVHVLLDAPVTKVNTKTFTLDLKYTMANVP